MSIQTRPAYSPRASRQNEKANKAIIDTATPFSCILLRNHADWAVLGILRQPARNNTASTLTMASNAAPRAGYLYAVCRQDVYDAVKVGFTCNAAPHAYVNDYARTLLPLQVIAVIAVTNARFAEGLAHHMLASKRLHDRHEVFNLSLPEGGFDQDLWQKVVDIIQTCDSMSGLPLPEDPQAMAQRREEAAAQKRQRREFVKTTEARLKEQRIGSKLARQRRQQEQEIEDDARQGWKQVCQEICLVRRDSMIRDFMDGAITKSDPEDFIKAKVLFDDFQGLQKQAGYQMTFKEFHIVIERLLPDAFKLRHYYKEAGVKHEATTVIKGFKRKRV